MTFIFVAALAGRYLLVVLLFPCSDLDKILNFPSPAGQARPVFKDLSMARAFILIAIGVEILMPIGILTGIADRPAAFIMAANRRVTAMLFKRFWLPGDFRVRRKQRERRILDFLKNFLLVDGFLLITGGLNRLGFKVFMHDPLASSHPYRLTSRPLAVRDQCWNTLTLL